MLRTIRLACVQCDRQDFDGISEDELAEAERGGWRDIDEVQTLEAAITTFPIGEEPPGFSVLDWWTHIGTCPDCAQKEGVL